MLRGIVATVMMAATWSSTEARPISREQARLQAVALMEQRQDVKMLTAVDRQRAGSYHFAAAPGQQRDAARSQGSKEQAEPYYVFDRGQAEGYIIVSGDDQTAESILGYCDEGRFDYDQLPPNMRGWLDDYARQIAWMQTDEGQAALGNSPIRRVPTHPAIAEMVKSRWNQGSPYNDECPMYFTLGRSVTGCVATAYAQLLYFQREKMVTETQAAMPAYDTWTEHPTYGHLHVQGIPAGMPLDWANMRDTYSGGETAVQKQAVAQLMHYCGVAVKMDYTNGASGAQSYEVYNALRNYFGFGSSVRYVSYQNVSSDEQWDDLCYQELAQGRPFYISGSNSEAGHAFVCDGYDGARRYHINWGWGGQSDGHYYLSNLTPGQQGIGGSNDGYNDYRECIMGIEPENYADRAMTFADATAGTLCTNAFDQDGDGRLTYGEAAQVKELGSVLQGSPLKTFTELHYFTALTSIDDDAFKGCQMLTNIQLPRQLTAIGARAFKDCTALQGIALPDALTTLGEQAFEGCTALKGIDLPAALTALPANAFADCSALAELTLPIAIGNIGSGALAGCTALQQLYVKTMQPDQIKLGDEAFKGSTTQATLHVMQGTRSFFAEAEQWKEFASVKEERELSRGIFAPFAEGQTFYLYHVGTGRYLTKGEAWGTQAVVGQSDPMRFVAQRNSTMPEGTYYLTSVDTGRDGHYLFRTNTDSNVGRGVQAAFVDGGNLTATAHWLLTDVGNNTYTLSIPKGYLNYDEQHRWGVDNSHASNAASPTWGVYSDIEYEGHEAMCQWRLVAYDADQTANFEAARQLQNLIDVAAAKRLSTTMEQQVLDNLGSTTDELLQAQRSLRKKLKLVDFADNTVRKTCIGNFDLDGDGELSIVEASQVAELGELFQNSTIASFDELQYFTSLKYLAGSTFNGCRQLRSVVLPESIERIYYSAFRNCAALEAITLPEYINTIGNQAFAGCTSLKTVTVCCPDPAAISIGTTIFSTAAQANATLQVPAGSKESYAQANTWKNFGNITEVRSRTIPRFSPVSEGATGYVYNVATRKFLAKGEAYGTQSVVAQKGLLYTWMRTKNMPQGQYYLYSSETGKDGKILFRTDTDTKVGSGVRACFVDGTLSQKAYWVVDSVADMTYTLQTPSGDPSYAEGQYLGTQADHQSEAASPTDGTYWDIRLADSPKQAQWRFITKEDMEAAQQQDINIETLRTLLATCEQRQIEKAEEQAVYDNLQSSATEIEEAIGSLRQKLHYIDFADSRAKAICLEAWDQNADGELTYEEAAQVTNIGETFRNQQQLKSLEALKHFTALKEIPENAFRNSSALTTIFLPPTVETIGQYAFMGCSTLKYIVVMNPERVVPAGSSSVPSVATVFVPEALHEHYAEADCWQACHIVDYTGTPTVTALPATRIYGRTIAVLKYEVSGAPINGDPVLSSDELAVSTTPVGTYAIHVGPGTITSRGLVCQEGVLTITPAPLTITAKSYSRRQGEPNPEFEVTYKGWRNHETADVLTMLPTVSCNATTDSPAGEYEIVVGGAEAQNYEMNYVSGVLTVTPATDAITNIEAGKADETLYDLKGRKVAKGKAQKGIYVSRGKLKVVRHK